MEAIKRDPELYKQISLSVEAEKFIELSKQMNIDVSQDEAMRLVEYLQMVLIKNCSLNLTAIREWDKALVLHLLDSLTLLEEFDRQEEYIQEMPFLDMGCGAGFPGIPLAIMRSLRTGVLCDSVRKKITAVDGFIHGLRLQNQLSTTFDRLEDYARYHKHEFGCVTARAVASLPILLEYAAPFMPRNGHLLVSKGQPTEDELQSGEKAAKICGFKCRSMRTIELPGDMGQRVIIDYVKIQEPSLKLPRSIGLAAKEPLA